MRVVKGRRGSLDGAQQQGFASGEAVGSGLGRTNVDRGAIQRGSRCGMVVMGAVDGYWAVRWTNDFTN